MSRRVTPPARQLIPLAVVCVVALTPQQEEASAQAAASAVSLSYALPDNVTLNEPVSLEIVATNAGTEEVWIDFGKNYVGNSQVVVTKPNGARSVVDPRKPLQADEAWVRGRMRLMPGARHEAELVLNDWVDFSQLGTHRLDVEFIGSVESTAGAVNVRRNWTSTLEALPRDVQRLREVAEALVRQVQSPNAAPAFLAARKLMHLRDPVAVPYLRRVLEERKGTWVDPIVIHALERIGNDDARAALLKASSSEDPFTSKAAFAAMDRLDHRQK